MDEEIEIENNLTSFPEYKKDVQQKERLERQNRRRIAKEKHDVEKKAKEDKPAKRINLRVDYIDSKLINPPVKMSIRYVQRIHIRN